MWKDAQSEIVVHEDPKSPDALFNELMQECKHSAPGARLSARLRTALERMSPEERRALVARTRDGCAPLFVASRRGNVEIVEYLVHVCDASLEQRGVYEVAEQRAAHAHAHDAHAHAHDARHQHAAHVATPLWGAAVAGRLGVLRALADAGADLDAPSDSGSTPVRSACFMTHLEVVRFLVSRGADVHRANHNGGTCLINAVQSARLCAFLLAQGVAPNARDTQLKTALHYAIQEHRLDTARLLVQHGADPALRSRAGDDALRTAALKGAAHIVSWLVSRGAPGPPGAPGSPGSPGSPGPPWAPYPRAQEADARELLGATQLDEFNDLSAAFDEWRRATVLRYPGGGEGGEGGEGAEGAYVEKTGWEGAERALGAREWRSAAELEALAADVDACRAQALLVCARVLGPAHRDFVFRLMYRGASYADAFRYQRCVELWRLALATRLQRDTLLHTDTVHTACALTRLMLDAHAARLERAPPGLPRHEDVLAVFQLIADALPECREWLRARPVHKRQAETFDRALRCATHLIHLLHATAACPAQRRRVCERVRALVRADVRSAHTGDTLLHLCASRLNVIRSTYFADEIAVPPVFPSASAARLLLASGACAQTRNEARSTALHVAAIPYNFSNELVEVLLAGGAHLDSPNRFGDSALELLELLRAAGAAVRVRVLRHVSLRCLAARALLAHPAPAARRPAPAALPAALRDWLALHRV